MLSFLFSTQLEKKETNKHEVLNFLSKKKKETTPHFAKVNMHWKLTEHDILNLNKKKNRKIKKIINVKNTIRIIILENLYI